MTDERAQFLLAVITLCQNAALASLELEVLTAQGRSCAGVPGSVRRARSTADELDDTGYERVMLIDDSFVDLDDVVECTIRSSP